jgi:serine/threonine protein phosphatase 1
MKLFGRSRSENGATRPPTGAANARAFAIGDVHGRLDLLRALLGQIEAERRARPCRRDYIVFLGDLVDRGPDSRGVIELVMNELPRDVIPAFLMGNHEEMVLRVLGGDLGPLWDWLDYGGYAFAQSYDVEVGRLPAMKREQAAALIRAAVPDAHIKFLEGFIDSFRFGDYLFVHAGIRPGTPIDKQELRDLRWIRDEFLTSEADHGVVVVHGHTVTLEPDERPNRIGIDTGAYATGVLTALVVHGENRSFISVGQ